MSYQEHVWPRTAAAEASSYPPLNKQSLDRLGYEDTIVIYLSTASPGNYITSAAYDSPRASTQYRGHAVLRNELDRRLETLVYHLCALPCNCCNTHHWVLRTIFSSLSRLALSLSSTFKYPEVNLTRRGNPGFRQFVLGICDSNPFETWELQTPHYLPTNIDLSDLSYDSGTYSRLMNSSMEWRPETDSSVRLQTSYLKHQQWI